MSVSPWTYNGPTIGKQSTRILTWLKITCFIGHVIDDNVEIVRSQKENYLLWVRRILIGNVFRAGKWRQENRRQENRTILILIVKPIWSNTGYWNFKVHAETEKVLSDYLFKLFTWKIQRHYLRLQNSFHFHAFLSWQTGYKNISRYILNLYPGCRNDTTERFTMTFTTNFEPNSNGGNQT